MKWSLKAKRSVEREISDLPGEELRVEALRKIGNLAENPFPSGSKKLKNVAGSLFRVRLGDYRIVYHVDQRSHEVEVIRVRHRRDVYRGL